MNIEQQHLNFQSAYVKTDYYKIYYELTNTTNSTFSWNREANRYTWHDVNSAWEMWLAAQQQEGYVVVPTYLTEQAKQRMLKVFNESDRFLNCENIYKAVIEASSQ